jgi:predicted nucleic acid-binding protein
VIYVDTAVVLHAVGPPHPLRDDVRDRLLDTPEGVLATSAAVLQEVLAALLPAARTRELDAAYRLVGDRMVVWPVSLGDLAHAKVLAATTPSLEARDLVHLAVAQRRRVAGLWTTVRSLAAAHRR